MIICSQKRFRDRTKLLLERQATKLGCHRADWLPATSDFKCGLKDFSSRHKDISSLQLTFLYEAERAYATRLRCATLAARILLFRWAVELASRPILTCSF